MKHVVLSTDATGQPKVDDVDSLDEALQLVERLRNDDGVGDVRVLREVPIEVKTYYKVVALESEASAAGEAAPAPAPDVDAAPSTDTGTSPAPDVAAAPSDDAPTPLDQPAAHDAGPGTDAPGNDGFFTPPPVRSHPIDEDEEPAPEPSPSERRTSLFGRG